MSDYIIKKTNEKRLGIDNKEWENAEIARVTTLNWEEFNTCPYTEARVMYNDEGIFLRFESDEEDIIAEFKNLNDNVYMESTSEIFFRPNIDNPDYFNFEVNAIGTPLIGLGPNRDRQRLPLKDISIFEFETKMKDKGFVLKFFVPFSFMEDYVGKIDKDYFLGNFQRCCELKNPPYFATYFPIKTLKADFHRPEYFGKLVFEK